MKIILTLIKLYLKIIYSIIKLFTKKKNQVFLISRQTNKPSLNYNMLVEYIKEKDSNIIIKVSCRRVSEGLNKIIHSNKKDLIKQLPTLFKELWNCFKYFLLLHKQMYYIATSKVIITDGYNLIISCLKHKKNTCIIQMWHALAAIKMFGYQSIGKADGMNPNTAKILNMHANYDYVLSGSIAMNKPFSEAFNTPIEKVLPIGTPYIDYLLNLKVKKKELFKDYPELLKKPIILYSPTFRKNGRDAIKEVIESVDTEKYNLVVTLHDLDLDKATKVKKDGIVINPKIDYPSLLKSADYCITDYSALMIEAAILKTKTLLYVYDYEQYDEENGLNINLFEELPNHASKDIKDLINIIEKDKYNMKTLLNFREKFITNLTKDSTKKIYDLIKGELK